MEKAITFWENMWKSHVLSSIIIVIVSIILYRCVTYFLDKGEKRHKVTDKKRKTFIKFTRNILRYIFISITILVLLQINGIDVSSVLAGVGLLGAILGLAMQDWLKDIIRGSSILSDNYFSVGDIVKYNDIEGKVLMIGLKSTKIQDLKTGYIKSIANRKIEEVDIVSNLIYIHIPMPYEVSLEKAEKVVEDIVNAIKKNDEVTDCRYIGVSDLADSSIKYGIEIACNPQRKLQVRRDALKSALIEMEKNGISVPYTQIDIHEK